MIETIPLEKECPRNVDLKADVADINVELFHVTEESLDWFPLVDRERPAWTVLVNKEMAKGSLSTLTGCKHAGPVIFMCASEADAIFCKTLLEKEGESPETLETYEATVHLIGSAALGTTLSLLWGNFCRHYWEVTIGETHPTYADIDRDDWEGDMLSLVWVDLDNATIVPLPLPLSLDIDHCATEPGKLLDGLLPEWKLPTEIEGGPEGAFQFLLNGFGEQPPLWTIGGVSKEHKVLHFPIVLKDPEDNKMHTPLFASCYAGQGAMVDLAPALAQHGVHAYLLPILSPTQFLEILGVTKVHNDVMLQSELPDDQATIVCLFDAETMFHFEPGYLQQKMARTALINAAALAFQLEVCTARSPTDGPIPRMTSVALDNPFMLPSTHFIGQLYADMLAGPLMSASRQTFERQTEAADGTTSTNLGEPSNVKDIDEVPE